MGCDTSGVSLEKGPGRNPALTKMIGSSLSPRSWSLKIIQTKSKVVGARKRSARRLMRKSGRSMELRRSFWTKSRYVAQGLFWNAPFANCVIAARARCGTGVWYMGRDLKSIFHIRQELQPCKLMVSVQQGIAGTTYLDLAAS